MKKVIVAMMLMAMTATTVAGCGSNDTGGPKLGDILDRLYEQVLDDPSLNEAQKLKELANKIITSLI